jgi:hypothetical protein
MAAWVSPYRRGRIWQNLFEMADELNLDLDATARLARVIETRAPFPAPAEAAEFLTLLSGANDLVKSWPGICERQRALRVQPYIANNAGRG